MRPNLGLMHRKYTDEQVQEWASMYLSGKSFKQIGIEKNVPWPTIHWNLKRINTPMRSVGRRDKVLSTRAVTGDHDKYSLSVRERNLKSIYGIDLKQYEEMLSDQNGVCKICKKPPSGKRTSAHLLHVDHDHQTKEVRGLLCGRCNVGLGQFQDSPELLRKAAAYLENR